MNEKLQQTTNQLSNANMKTVVIVAPQFAPCSYPPALRVRFFTNHLEEFGWRPLILTVKPEYMEEPADPEFTQMIPQDLNVIRTKALNPKLTRKIGVGDLGIRCFPYMLKTLRHLCKNQHIDLLFIPGPPWHTFCLGPILKNRFGIPYVIDYIDPWVTPGPFHPWKKAFWFRMMAYMLEPIVLRKVDMITAVSKGTCDTVNKRFPYLKTESFSVIPYGCEESDFDYVSETNRKHTYWNAGDGKIHLCYVGAVWPPALDTVKALLDALVKLRDSKKELFDKIQIHFLGTSYNPDATPQVLPLAYEKGLDNISELTRRIPYLDALTVLKSADVILALGSSDSHYTPSKIYPCLVARRPLLGIFHEQSSVVDVLKEMNTGIVVTYNTEQPPLTQVTEISSALIRACEKPVCEPDGIFQDRFNAYSARSMARRLASVFDAATDGFN